jgi:hypothetical protein
VPNLEFMRIDTKSSNFSWCLNYHPQGVVSDYENRFFLVYPVRLGGVKLVLHKLIWNLGQWSHAHKCGPQVA